MTIEEIKKKQVQATIDKITGLTQKQPTTDVYEAIRNMQAIIACYEELWQLAYLEGIKSTNKPTGV